eukprot:scaffold11342_cov114-Isochrysis_galbana.AAC.14
MVLRDGTIDVVGDVGGANAVVQPVDQWRVRPVDGEECAAHVREGVIVEMRHIHISVLQPCVRHQPCIDHQQRAGVQRRHPPPAVPGGGRAQHPQHRRHARARVQHLVRPPAGPQRGRKGRRRPKVVARPRRVPGAAARDAGEEVGWPPDGEVAKELAGPVESVAEAATDGDGFGPTGGVNGGSTPQHDGHVRFAPGHVVGVRVVHGVRALPREVGH